jgi:TRAP transporter TAXI family solute receptor
MRFLKRAAAVAAIGLAACGGTSPDGAADGGPGADEPARPVTIGANPAGTHVYAVAAGLARVLQEKTSLRATIRPFSGSSVYLPLLQRGEIAVGLNTSIDCYLSYRSLPPWEMPMSNLRALGMMFPLRIMYMVRADSGLTRIEDLRGRRVVVTFRANASLAQLHEGILATGGLTLDDIEPMTVAGLPEAMRMLQEGRADAVPTGLNTALSLQVNAALPGGIRYLTMGADEARLPQIMPGSRVVTVAADDSGVGIDEPIRTSEVGDYLNASTHLSEERAYEIIRAIHASWDELTREHAQMRPVAAEEVAPVDFTHPFHPGAIRYFTEAGLWTEAHEARQRELLALHRSP